MKNKKGRIIPLIIIGVLILIYIGVVLYNYFTIKDYDNKVFPNSYLEGFDLSNYKFNELNKKISIYNDSLVKKELTIICNGKEYKYKYSDLGFHIDYDKTITEIKKYQNGLSYSDKVSYIIAKKGEKNYSYYLKYDEDILKKFLDNFKSVVHVDLVNAYFDASGDSVRYSKGSDSFDLNIDKSIKAIDDVLGNEYKIGTSIELFGDSNKSNSNPKYEKIDTKVSSFSTQFNQYITARATNLRTALNYINGAIVEPGEVFSYYKYAGPYNKQGYVFYYEFVGNGVCQIATTVYNAALLGGLEIVKRYPHAKQSVYVPGGLDATVASYSGGWNVDFQFKNTYEYPIYIKAYANGGTATVEFWSNSDAKKGKTYSTESVRIGTRGYKTFLHTFDSNGKELSRDYITTTWYSKE